MPRGLSVRLAESGNDCKSFLGRWELFPVYAVSLASNKNKGEQTMDDLRFNPSALLIVGMLIGVVEMLVKI